MYERPTSYPKLDRRLGLHEELSIYYVVDGFCASLSTDDGSKCIDMADGPTLEEAIAALEAKL